MNLRLRLNEILEQNPREYSQTSIRRVGKVIQHIENHPGGNIPYREFLNISDYKLYASLYPELEDLSTEDMKKDSTGRALYTAVLSFARKKAQGDEELRRKLVKSVFPQIGTYWKRYKSIDEWVSRYESNTEWDGKTMQELMNDTVNGGKEFCESFNYWTKIQSKGHKEDARMLKRIIYINDTL